ncbi:radical SAM protein [Candidatus Woesearchaeota archaeon]|nr:radical SAM protein [Candidatus Woesearchaeota archaeon]
MERINQRGLGIISKVTESCNLACKYCYAEHDNKIKSIMSDETLENTITKCYEFSGERKDPHFIWHGGEPLLGGLEFFKNVIKIQDKFKPHKISNVIQTNATLINDEILDFFIQNNIHVGTSIDGPEEIHNLTRIYWGSTGAFKDVMGGVEKMRKKGMDIGAIVVLNKKNVNHISEIYEFFKRENIGFKANPLIKCGRAIKNYEDLSITPKEYGKALIKLFDLWYNDFDNMNFSCDTVEELLGNITTAHPRGCDFSEGCQGSYISVSPNGEVYPCGRFGSDTPDYCLGNINKNSLDDIFEEKTKKKLLERTADAIEGCRPCEYKQICNGGCMHNAYMKNGNIMDKDFYCAGYKMVLNHIKSVVKKDLGITG